MLKYIMIDTKLRFLDYTNIQRQKFEWSSLEEIDADSLQTK